MTKTNIKKEIDALEDAMEIFWRNVGFGTKVSETVEEDQQETFIKDFGDIWDALVDLHNALEKFRTYEVKTNT